MSKVAVFLANGFEEVEALTPVDYLRRAGAEVFTVAVNDNNSQDNLIIKGSHNIIVVSDITLKDFLNKFSSDLPDCLFCPGGLKGSKNLSETEELLAFLEKANKEGKIISAICAAPALVLGKTSIPSGKKWTCYPGMAEEGNPDYLNNYTDKVFVTDGNLVTSRGAGAAEEFAVELIKLLEGNEKAKKVHDSTLQR